MNQLFLDKLHEARTAKNEKLLEAVEQMYIICEQKAQVEGVKDIAKKYGSTALATAGILGGLYTAGNLAKQDIDNRSKNIVAHETSCGTIADDADLNTPFNFDMSSVVEQAKTLEVNLRKTGTIGGTRLANELYQLTRDIEDGQVDENTSSVLNAKVEQSKRFIDAVKTGVCKDGKKA